MQSYQIGVARLLNKYKFEDPLTEKDIVSIENILSENLADLIQLCKSLNISTLIGSSGSYETFANLIKYEFDQSNLRDDDSYNIINIDFFKKIHQKLISFDFDQRKNMPGMEIIRVQLIPIASVVTKYLLKELNIKTLIQSNYSIKEGLIFDYLSQNKK
jgi:exopolyphosphatase/guanosine-5'-triphosphate,3'-diphosphate pyrophosphatase